MHVVAARFAGGIVLMALLAWALAGCAALSEIQKPPPPEPGRNVWRELLDNGERK